MELIIAALILAAVSYYWFGIRYVKELNSDKNQHEIAELLLQLAEREKDNDAVQFESNLTNLICILEKFPGKEARKRVAHAMTLVQFKAASIADFNQAKLISLEVVKRIGW
jgi:aspartyl aminopeptidase